VPPVFEIGLTRLKVLTSAVVDRRVQFETPDESVAEQTLYVLPLPEFVAKKVGVVPTTALLLPSFSVMVMVDDETPFATTGPLPVMLELVLLAEGELGVLLFPDPEDAGAGPPPLPLVPSGNLHPVLQQMLAERTPAIMNFSPLPNKLHLSPCSYRCNPL